MCKDNKILSDISKIVDYINGIDNFHDYLIGKVSYNGKSFHISIEEDCLKTDVSNKGALGWCLTFEDIEMFEFNCDCIVGFYIYEVVYEDGDFVFYSSAGCFQVRAKSVQLIAP